MSDFTTKDSGQRAQYASGMVRDTDEGKPRFDLLLPEGVPYAEQFLTRCAELMARGASKYTERNWEQANSQTELDRYKSSALRHLMQWMAGEDDEDHAAATFFNLLAHESTRYKMEQRKQHFYATFPFSDEDESEEQIDVRPVWWVDETRYWVNSMTSDQATALTKAFRARAAGKYIETSNADEVESIYCECGCNEPDEDIPQDPEYF